MLLFKCQSWWINGSLVINGWSMVNGWLLMLNDGGPWAMMIAWWLADHGFYCWWLMMVPVEFPKVGPMITPVIQQPWEVPGWRFRPRHLPWVHDLRGATTSIAGCDCWASFFVFTNLELRLRTTWRHLFSLSLPVLLSFTARSWQRSCELPINAAETQIGSQTHGVLVNFDSWGWMINWNGDFFRWWWCLRIIVEMMAHDYRWSW